MQELFLVINTIFAIVATGALATRIPTSGARVWVTVYALGIAMYGMIVFGLSALGIIQDEMISYLMRWLWSAVFVYLIVDIITDRRRQRGYK